MKLIAVIVALVAAAWADPANSADLVGRWEGSFHCRWKEGREGFRFHDRTALMFISQSGDELRILLEGAGYDGRLHVSEENPGRGTIAAEGCLNDGNALGGVDDVVQMRFGKRREAYFIRGSFTTAGSLGGPGRCSFKFKRVHSNDVGISDCNAP